MENPSPAAQVLASLRNGHTGEAMACAIDHRDVHGLVACLVYLRPSLTSFRQLRDLGEIGARLATSLVFVGVRADADLEIYDESWKIIDCHADEFELTPEQIKYVHELLTYPSSAEYFDAVQRSQLLGWYHANAPEDAIDLARIVVDSHDEAESDKYKRYALKLVGSTTDTEDHARLHRLSTRLIDAGRVDVACSALSMLGKPQRDDLEAVIEVILSLALSGGAIPEGLVTLIERLPTDLAPSLLEQSADSSDLSSWAPNYFLPVLFAPHLPALVATFGESWWPDWALDWATRHINWSDQEDRQILLSIQNLSAGARLDHAMNLRTALGQIICQSDRADSRANYHPRLGAAYLLSEALRGTIDPRDEILVNALRHIDRRLRIELYCMASWRRVERAKVAVEVIACVDESDLTEHDLLDQIVSLRPQVRDAILADVAQRLSDDEGSYLVGLLAQDESAARILAGVASTRPAVVALWADSASLLAFEALHATSDGSETGRAYVEFIEKKVRDYSNSLGASDRIKITHALDVAVRIDLLAGVIADREQAESRRPPKEVLIAAIDELGTIDDSDAVFEALAKAGEAILDTVVRCQIVRALSRQRPTRGIAEYLYNREKDEVPSLVPVVQECLDSVAEKLNLAAGDEDNRKSESALGILVDVRPTLALPHARQRLFAADLDTRRAAVSVLGSHGEEEDISRLERVLKDEPQLSIREEIRAAIRLLTVGDLAGAHEELGRLGQISDPGWGALDVSKMYGSFGPLLVSGLDRVMSNRHSGQWGQAIDQLSEVAKCLLYRAVEVAGSTIGLKSTYIGQVSSNTADYGAVLGYSKLLHQWRWVSSFVSLYQLRTEHLASKGSLTPAAVRSQEDLTAAMVLFREGSKECLSVIRSAIAVRP